MGETGETRKKPDGGLGRTLLLPLVALALIELISYRLASPVLRPSGDDPPGLAHELLENVGLFGFHFSSLLAAVVLVLLVVHRNNHALTAVGCALAALATLAQLLSPAPVWLELALQLSYALTVVVVVTLTVRSPGDLGVKIAVTLLAVPLIIHVWTPFALRWYGAEALFDGLPETAVRAGQWTLILVASLSPYVLAPRPFIRAVTRPGPLLIALTIGISIALLVRSRFEAAATLAEFGLGLSVGVAAPEHLVALAVLALSTLTWTLVSCLLAPSPARRRIGVGLALMILAGYGFQWPLQYTLGAVALIVISGAAAEVAREERRTSRVIALSAPPILPETWEIYLDSLEHALADHVGRPVTRSRNRTGASERASLSFERDGWPWNVAFEKHGGVIVSLSIIGGCRVDEPPDATLSPRSRSSSEHPAAPMCRARAAPIGDDEIDEKFVVRADSLHIDELLPDQLHRAIAEHLDGWLAVWAERRVEYKIYPGRGAPLDRPLPITELSFRGDAAAMDTTPMLGVADVLFGLAGTTRAAPSES